MKGDKREKREILYQKVRTEGREGTGTFYDPMGIKMGPFYRFIFNAWLRDSLFVFC